MAARAFVIFRISVTRAKTMTGVELCRMGVGCPGDSRCPRLILVKGRLRVKSLVRTHEEVRIQLWSGWCLRSAVLLGCNLRWQGGIVMRRAALERGT
jgi:hypothetical protein